MSELFLKLLGAQTSRGGEVVGSSWQWSPVLSWPFWVLLLLALGGAAWMVFRNLPVDVSRHQRRWLLGLRWGFLLLLSLLFLRPSLILRVEGNVRQPLLLLIDGSASMRLAEQRFEPEDASRAAIGLGLARPGQNLKRVKIDAGQNHLLKVSRLDLARAALTNQQMKLLSRLEKDFEVVPFEFDQELRPIAHKGRAGQTNHSVTAALSGIRSEGPVTALGEVLQETRRKFGNQSWAGVILISDGASNAGSDPVEVAAEMKKALLPVFAYGVGVTAPRDLVISELVVPALGFVRDEWPVQVRVRSPGLAGVKSKLQLRLNKVVVAEKEISLDTRGEQMVTIPFTPPAAGTFELEASLPARADETSAENNLRRQTVRVGEGKIKILLVDQSPRWEFRYLQAMLGRDRRVDLKCVLVEGDPAISRLPGSPFLPGFPSRKNELFPFDLVILGDVDPKHLPPETLQNLSEFVSQAGGGLVLVCGKNFLPASYDRTFLENLSPVDFEPGAGREGASGSGWPIRLELTAVGRKNPVMKLASAESENLVIWKELPGFLWAAKAGRAKPAAEVLLVDGDSSQAPRYGKTPLLAWQQYGIGQVVYLGSDNTWRWRKNSGDYYYTYFWGQLIQRLASQRLLGGLKRTQLTLDGEDFLPGDRIRLYARLYGPAFEPLQTAQIKASFQGPKGVGEVFLRASPEHPGLYFGDFSAGAPGPYQLRVESDPQSVLEFKVGENQSEFFETAMNESVLKKISAASGGAFFREEDLHRLPEIVHARRQKITSRLPAEVWSSPLCFLLLLALLTAEWILRKRFNLK